MRKFDKPPVFDYRTLRLLMGVIAVAIPFVVFFVEGELPPSISYSYHTGARDFLVGMLCIVGVLMWGYNGTGWREWVIYQIGAFAALCIAFFPTPKDCHGTGFEVTPHGVATAIFFAVLVYICLCILKSNVESTTEKGDRRRRNYRTAGYVMIACIGAIFGANFIWQCNELRDTPFVFFAEAVALIAFGFAWITAAKVVPQWVDKDGEDGQNKRNNESNAKSLA